MEERKNPKIRKISKNRIFQTHLENSICVRAFRSAQKQDRIGKGFRGCFLNSRDLTPELIVSKARYELANHTALSTRRFARFLLSNVHLPLNREHIIIYVMGNTLSCRFHNCFFHRPICLPQLPYGYLAPSAFVCNASGYGCAVAGNSICIPCAYYLLYGFFGFSCQAFIAL